MRHVFSTYAEVCHHWANQMNIPENERYASTPDGHVYYTKWAPKEIYSYGRHFCLARLVTDNVVLLNNTSYSKTTAKHQSAVWGATMHMTQIMCPDPTSTRCSMDSWHDEVNGLLKKLYAANKPELYLDELAKLMSTIARYREYVPFKLKEYRWYQSAVLSRDITKHWMKECRKFKAEVERDREYAREERERKERIKKERIEAENKKLKAIEEFNANWREFIGKWESGELNSFPHLYDRRLNEDARRALVFDYLREKGEKGRLETSKGVVIPRDIAREFGARLKAGLIKAGDKIMYYAVRFIENGEIAIGCHTFKLDYLIGWYDRISSDAA